MTETNSERFEQWCIVELMGHRRLAGKLTEQEIAGASFLRLDVPTGCGAESDTWCPVCGRCICAKPEEGKCDAKCKLHSPDSKHGQQFQATQFYSPSAVYCITPTTEEIARKVAAGAQPSPVQAWELAPHRTDPNTGDDDDQAY